MNQNLTNRKQAGAENSVVQESPWRGHSSSDRSRLVSCDSVYTSLLRRVSGFNLGVHSGLEQAEDVPQ